ncbi:MAG: dinitrogenase iron-molybdenum cofactor biosynthesis protein [Desulfobacteraceae bacterium]|nr:MAG: dinitrogenase iron-molybdenum cofactor biosynthesis protein [Desulfobacteraceae bacterium]
MIRKIFIPLHEEEVAPRFDLATAVLMAECDADGRILQEKVLILPGPSAERLCHTVMTEHVQTVICGGIEQEVYDYLTWKRIEVIDNVIGSGAAVLRRYLANDLRAGEIVQD